MGCGQSQTKDDNNKDIKNKDENQGTAPTTNTEKVKNNSDKNVDHTGGNHIKKDEKDVDNKSLEKVAEENADQQEEEERKKKEEREKLLAEEEEARNKMINDEEDSIDLGTEVELPTPIVCFGVFPPKVNKFRILQQPLDNYGFHPISTKEILQMELDKGGETADSIKGFMENKENIPGEVMTKLLLEYIENTQKEKKVNRFFVSGFPRCEDNSKSWKSLSEGKAKVLAIIFLSYTRKEYHKELEEEERNNGQSFDYTQMDDRFNYFILNTRYVFDDFGKKRVINMSAALDDNNIQSKVFKSGLFKKLD